MTQIDASRPSPSSFWTFSLSIYGRPGVPAACLTLQDGSGVDVNLLLFGLFLGRQGRKIAPDDLKTISKATEPWRANVVVSLRDARRALKEPPAPFTGTLAESLRKSVKAAELEAERIQQEMLFVTFPAQDLGVTEENRENACAANVDAYRHFLGAQFNEDAISALLSAAAATGAKR